MALSWSVQELLPFHVLLKVIYPSKTGSMSYSRLPSQGLAYRKDGWMDGWMDRWTDTWVKGRKARVHWIIENLDPPCGDGKGLTDFLVHFPILLTALLQLGKP